MKNKWGRLIILYLAAVTVSLGQLKIVPIMSGVAQAAGVNIPQVGLLISIFTLAGVVLAIPGGAILARIGSKNLLMGLMVMLSLGNVIGALTNNYYLLLASRLIEGVAFSMIITTGLVMITGWFKGAGTNSAVGIFTTFPAVANFAVMLAVPVIVQSAGGNIKSVWWIIAGMAALCFILVKFLIPQPGREEYEEPSGEHPLMRDAAKNHKVWLMAFSHACIAFILFGYITCYPLIFMNVYGQTAEAANRYTALNGLFGIFACIFCGVLIDKLKKPYAVALIGRAGTIVTVAFTMSLASPAGFIVHLFMVALLVGGIGVTSNLCIGPTLAKSPAYIGYNMSFINLLYYIGAFACTPVLLGAAESSGWGAAELIMVIVSAAAAVLMLPLLIPPKNKRK
jgi:predicted MFS family arabinose efflux permease